MRYDFTDLLLFVNVVEAGTIGAGARATFLTPASASERIKGMEEALGQPLLLRGRKGVSLTEAGMTVLRHARAVCDLGVLSDAADTAGLECHPFRSDPLVLVVPAGHALARRRTMPLAELPDADFIGLGEDSALQQLVSRQMRRSGRRLRYRARVRSLDSVCAIVGQGIGVGIVPAAVAERARRGAASAPSGCRTPGRNAR
jgi:DNA-binding transcriptional LysR family regulator